MLQRRVIAGTSAIVVLSLIAAIIFATVSEFDRFVPAWSPHMLMQTKVALRVPFSQRLIENPDRNGTKLDYRFGRIIVSPYTVLDDSDPAHRQALAYERLKRKTTPWSIGATLALYAALSVFLSMYVLRLGQSRMKLLRVQIGMFALIFMALAFTKLLLLFTGLPEMWSPVALIPLWIGLAFDRRSALLVNVVLSFLVASLLRFDLLFLIVTIARGMTVVLTTFDRRRPRSLLLAGVIGGISSAVVYVGVASVLQGSFNFWADLQSWDQSYLVACLGGGLLVGLAGSVLRDPVERLLGQVPRDHLLDLTDIEQPLLKKLAKDAPGTWEHSRAMANLAEVAASAIGADALLTRVGAYYHDLGKTVQPKYFVENLGHGEKSPHDDLPPEVSADAIMAHVVLGTKILRESGIPEPVVEFAYTHHGTQVVEFFWHKYLEQNPEPELDKNHFRYPGMRPQTKETAIVMLVDSIEAASRTVNPATRENFDEMIRRIVFIKLRAGQLDESDLSLEDLNALVERMGAALANMYHGRIRYPWQREKDRPPAQSFTTPKPPDIRRLSTPPPDPPLDTPNPSTTSERVATSA